LKKESSEKNKKGKRKRANILIGRLKNAV